MCFDVFFWQILKPIKDYEEVLKQSDHYLVEFKVRYSEYENDSLVNKETSIIPCRLPLNSIILSSNDPVVQPND